MRIQKERRMLSIEERRIQKDEEYRTTSLSHPLNRKLLSFSRGSDICS